VEQYVLESSNITRVEQYVLESSYITRVEQYVLESSNITRVEQYVLESSYITRLQDQRLERKQSRANTTIYLSSKSWISPCWLLSRRPTLYKDIRTGISDYLHKRGYIYLA